MSVNYTQLDAEQLEYVPVAAEGELPNGERLFVEIDDYSIVVFNIAGKLFAIADICSHDDGPLGEGALEGEYEIACPRHGARFDVRSGAAKTLPAIVAIPAFPVRIQDGQIEIGIPTN